MHRSLRVVVIFVIGAGCSGKEWHPLDASVLAKSPGISIGTVQAKTPQFWANTFGRRLFGLVGVTAMAVAGQQIVKENRIVDPSPALASRLMMALTQKFRLAARTPRPISAPGDRVRWDTDLYLQVQTEQWGITDFSDDWDHYRVHYEVSLELHDSRTQRVIASGQCTSLPEDSRGAPSYDKMLLLEAVLLKKKLEEAVEFCFQKFSKELLGTDLPVDRTPMPVAVDAQTLYASCKLEETPAWKAAGPAERHRMLEECWNKRRFQVPAAAPSAVKP
jgi:hypothetical protein